MWAERTAAHSALMLAARITLPHFSVYSTMNLPNSAGELANGVAPKSTIRAFMLGSERAARISSLCQPGMIPRFHDGARPGLPTSFRDREDLRSEGLRARLSDARPRWR